jgi:hypothetical protein
MKSDPEQREPPPIVEKGFPPCEDPPPAESGICGAAVVRSQAMFELISPSQSPRLFRRLRGSGAEYG